MKKADKKLIGEWLDTIAITLRKKVHASGCKNDHKRCPASCSCRKDAKIRLNLKTAIVWTAAEHVHDIAGDFLFTRSARVKDLEKLSDNIGVLQDPIQLHQKTHEGIYNILEYTKRAILNMQYYLSDMKISDDWCADMRVNSVNHFIRDLKRCRNLRR